MNIEIVFPKVSPRKLKKLKVFGTTEKEYHIAILTRQVKEWVEEHKRIREDYYDFRRRYG
jgi:hypothetical protein